MGKRLAELKDERRTLTLDEFHSEAKATFGDNSRNWRFKCPSCGHVASVQEWHDAGAPEGAVAFSCIGRYLGADGTNAFKNAGGPCNYTGGGLFGLNPWTIVPPAEHGKPYDIFAIATRADRPGETSDA